MPVGGVFVEFTCLKAVLTQDRLRFYEYIGFIMEVSIS
jgi:hypothetical protein